MRYEAKPDRLYRAHMRLLTFIGFVTAVGLVVIGASATALFVSAGALGALWALLTYVRLKRVRPGHESRGRRSRRAVMADRESSPRAVRV
jgi:hypothetical protein